MSASVFLANAGRRLIHAQSIIPSQGSYEYLRPLYTLPYDESNVELPYNPNTGLVEGTVFECSNQRSRDWWIANSDTVVTVAATGGDYPLTGLQTALDDAATANDIRVIVIDSGAVVTLNAILPVKPTNPNWTLVCSSDWWGGTWQPSGNRYLDCDTEIPHLAEIRGAANTNTIRATGAGRDCYAFIGCLIRRFMGSPVEQTASLVYLHNDSAVTKDDLPHSHVFNWCWFDGVYKSNDIYYRTRRGIRPDSLKCALYHTVMTGFAGTGDTQAIATINGGGRLQVEDCLLEATSENFMCGGGAPNPNFLPEDMVFNRVYFVKRQEWNSRSSVYDSGMTALNVKNAFETKHGRRVLVQASVLENCWVDGQTGPMVVLKTTNQSNLTFLHDTSDVTIRLCAIRNGGTILSISFFEYGSGGGTLNHVNTYPLNRVEWTANLGVSDDASRTGVSGNAINLNSAGGFTHPEGYPFGPVSVRWSTFATLNSVGFGNVMSMPAILSAGSGISDSIVDYGANFGITSTQGPLSAAALEYANFIPSRTVWCESPPGRWLRRVDFTTLYPEQADVKWWDETSSSAPRPAPTTLFANRAARNFALHPSNPAQGQADGGRNPGAPLELIEAATSGVADAPSFITVEFT